MKALDMQNMLTPKGVDGVQKVIKKEDPRFAPVKKSATRSNFHQRVEFPS
jgi:hypothetical protein